MSDLESLKTCGNCQEPLGTTRVTVGRRTYCLRCTLVRLNLTSAVGELDELEARDRYAVDKAFGILGLDPPISH
jgi:hypothetical protein